MNESIKKEQEAFEEELDTWIVSIKARYRDYINSSDEDVNDKYEFLEKAVIETKKLYAKDIR